MRLFKVEMGGFEPWLWADEGNHNELQKSWTQQPSHWSLFFFEHPGIMTVNNKPIPYEIGNVGFVVPGTKVEFLNVGEGTRRYLLSFGLKARTETVAIPAVADLGQDVNVRRKEFEDSFKWLHTSIMRGLACAFNTLWSISQPAHIFRKSDLVFDAEALIIKRLHERINIQELADELAISHTHLLRLFREQLHDSRVHAGEAGRNCASDDSGNRSQPQGDRGQDRHAGSAVLQQSHPLHHRSSSACITGASDPANKALAISSAPTILHLRERTYSPHF